MVGTILYETLTKKTKKQTNLIQNGPSHPDYIGQPLSVWNLFFCFFWSMLPGLGIPDFGHLWSLWFFWSMPLGLDPPGVGLLWSLWCFFGLCLILSETLLLFFWSMPPGLGIPGFGLLWSLWFLLVNASFTMDASLFSVQLPYTTLIDMYNSYRRRLGLLGVLAVHQQTQKGQFIIQLLYTTHIEKTSSLI